MEFCEYVLDKTKMEKDFAIIRDCDTQNSDDILNTLKYTEIKTMEKHKNNINLIMLSLIVFISLILIIFNLKINYYFHLKYNYNIQDINVGENDIPSISNIENKINKIRNDQGIYSDDDYKKEMYHPCDLTIKMNDVIYLFKDAGARMIHLAPNTSSQIISKSICREGGKVNYRGTVHHGKNAINARSYIQCDTLILDNLSSSDTIPKNRCYNNQSIIEHEATVSKVSDEQLFYLMSRGLSKQQAMQMIVLGFIEPFSKELPMEYAVELNQLLKLNMENSIG